MNSDHAVGMAWGQAFTHSSPSPEPTHQDHEFMHLLVTSEAWTDHE